MEKVPTPESLRHDRERRSKQREDIAQAYDDAADELVKIDGNKYRQAIAHLRLEAMDWRRE